MNNQYAIDITFFVACYNEVENITATLETLVGALKEFDLTWEIIVIDDASIDGSPTALKKFLQKNPDLPISVKVNETNKGLAQNYIEGAFIGKGKYYRLICGDNVEPKEALATVFSNIGKADIIIPYHSVAQGKSYYRKKLSKAYTMLINFLTGYRIRYYNGMAVHLRYNVMRWHTNYRGFGFQADMLTRLLDAGFSYIEVPIQVVERRSGQSTALSLKNVLSISHTILDICIRQLGKLVYREQ
jgi:glycosyltransferase involved in cell wall biosynthesis